MITINFTNYLKKQITLLAILIYGFVFSQSNPALEMTTGDGNPTTVSTNVASNTNITLRKNTDNPTANTFATYSSPSTLSVTYTLSNQVYTQTNTTGYNGGVYLGYPNEAILVPLNSFGATSSSLPFTSNGGTVNSTTNNGINITSNYGVQINNNVQPLTATNKATNTRWQMADLTITFSRAVNNPYLQINALGGNSNGTGYTAEFDYVSSNVPISFSKVSGTSQLNVNSTQILNSANTPDASDANSARGTVLVSGIGITTFTLRIYTRGGVTNTGTNWGTGIAGDGYMLGITLAESDLRVTKTVDNTTPVEGSIVNFTVTASNLGASNNTNVTVNDLLPSGYTYGSHTASRGTYNPSTGVWSIGNLNDQANATLTITAKVNPTGNYTNTATISTTSGISDPVTTNNSASVSTTPTILDSDGDGIPNSLDLDDDNDGILDSNEGCTTTVTVGTVSSQRATDLINTSTTIFPLTPVGTSLPNGGVRLTRTAGANTWGTFTPPVTTSTVTVQGVTSAPFSTTYLDLIGTIPRTLNIDFGTTATALSNTTNDYTFMIGIAGLGGESTNVTATTSVPISVAGNSNVFNTNLYSLFNGTVSTTVGLTGTSISTNTPNNTAQGYTFFTIPKNVSSYNITYTGANDPHGLLFAVISRNCTNTDGDAIPNYLDTDSDGDGCSDAAEGDENVLYQSISSGRITGTVDSNGVPNIVNSGGIADIGSDQGQGIGNSQNSSVIDCKCNLPAASGTITETTHGITALGRTGSDNGNWPMNLNGAWTAIEAKTKGFVINRLTTSEINTLNATPSNLRIGMMIYNTSLDCLYINIDGTAAGWKCFNTQTCPINF